MSRSELQKNIDRILNRINKQNEIIVSYEDDIPKLEIDLMLDQIRRLYGQYLDFAELGEETQSPVPEIRQQPVKKVDKVELTEEVKEVAEPKEEQPFEVVEEQAVNVEIDFTESITPEFQEVKEEEAPIQKDEPQEVKVEDEIQKKLEEELTKVENDPDPMIAEELEKLKQYFPSIPDDDLTVDLNELKKDQPEEVEEHVVEQQEIIISEENIIPKEEKITESKKEAPKTDVIPQQEKKDLTGDLFEDQPTVADKFQNEKKSVYDQVHNSIGEPTIADKISKHAVGSIKTSIGLNDKFAFINGLFKGSLNEYNQAIDELDNMDFHHDAQRMFGQLSTKFGWNQEDETVIRFAGLIEQKFK